MSRSFLAARRPVLSLFALSTLALAASAHAQSNLEPVVVTGTREAQPLRRSVADIVLVDSDTLRDSGVDTVEEALRRFGGLQILRNGGPGQSSGYFLRGTGTSSTLVLVDGVRVGSATLGQAEFESMSLAQVDRIEVLRGPASSLYGAGGVIQIFTRRGQGPLQVSGAAAVGSYGSAEGSLAVSGSQGAFDYAASVAHERSRGVSAIRPNDQFGNYNPDNDGFKRSSGSVRLGFTPMEGHRIGLNASESKLNAQYDSAEYPPPDYKPDPSPDFRNRLTTRLVAADYRGRISDLWTTTLQAAHNTDDSLSGGTVLSLARYKTDRDQFTWQNALKLDPDQQLMLAYEQMREEVRADAFASKLKRTNKAGVLGYAGQFGPAALEASLRRDDNSAYGGNTTGSIGASYALTSTLKLRALAGKTYRAPTFNDLYFPGYGVATVRPEKGRSAELGLNWLSGSSSASLTVYRNKVRDLIGYDPDPSHTDCPSGYFGCASNVSRATLQGATLAATHRLGNLSLRASVDVLDAQDDITHKRLNRRAAHQESLSADYDAGAWSAGASLTDIGARPDSGITLGAYALLDLRASWRFMPQWRLEAKVLNAGDHRVEPVRDYQGLGRQAWIGLRFDTKGL
ncbi:TonB-dependent receptor domain-containing protein [Roseateles saccharophilus]|uniref:Vitamin B12 transporter n=1 Tax=Roseateles saccharophilus TaxID=304 RepID=A0A4R3UTH2_ROSSA|nr:TonB-dependent receptor [Roseateles saccharophilus]MDG0833267.1 TonB-dependent receptor [Roseateles saccharophilus]TCU94382.1 vitamin B12 transporter [Roseateles saccharophilus]